MFISFAVASVCNLFTHYYEKAYKIPKGLLTSISLIESGRRLQKNHISAHPWTLNVDGRAYILSSMDEAIKTVGHVRSKGANNVDVGCMQISLKHHPHAFNNLRHALDPKSNVEYAARFLRSLYLKHGTWDKAVRHYHSASPIYNSPYKSKVMGMLTNLHLGYISTGLNFDLPDIQQRGEISTKNSHIKFAPYGQPMEIKPQPKGPPRNYPINGFFYLHGGMRLKPIKATYKISRLNFMPIKRAVS